MGEKAKPEIESAGKLVTSISFASAGTTGCAEAPKNDIACSLMQRGGRGELIAFKKKLEVSVQVRLRRLANSFKLRSSRESIRVILDWIIDAMRENDHDQLNTQRKTNNDDNLNPSSSTT